MEWGLRQREVVVTYHTEFLAHRCYGGIWPAGDSRSVAAKRIETGSRGAGTPGEVGCLLTLAVAHTAQALPHFPCWLLEPRAEDRAETGSTLRRFIASAIYHSSFNTLGGRTVIRDCGGFSQREPICQIKAGVRIKSEG